jgi:hypothetical protein
MKVGRKSTLPQGLEPSKLYTSFAGFPISQYAIYKYTLRGISIVLDFMSMCHHGETCTKCCFLYTGPLRIKNSAKTTSKATVYPIHDGIFGKRRYFDPTYVTRFTHELIFGEIYGLNKLVRTCGQSTCGNIHHVRIYFSNKSLLSNILRSIKKCEHGEFCSQCCWDWTKFIRKRQTENKEYFSIEPGKKMIRRVLCENILGIHLGKKLHTKTTCSNPICVSWNHIRIVDNSYASYKMIEKNALARQQLKGQT